MKPRFFLYPSLLLIALVSIISCKEESDPSISVSPVSIEISATPGSLIEFNVSVQKGTNALRNVTIMQKPSGGFTTTIKDSSMTSSGQFFYVFSVPTNLSEVLLTFSIFDEEGNSNSVLRNVVINNGTLLTETTGYELYSPYAAGQVNAFNLDNLTPLQLQTNPDSSLVDLIEFDPTDDGEISSSLTSLSDIKFVRNNSFNYSGATSLTAQASYTSSTPLQLISNIQNSDILIAEYDSTDHKYAVIKITGINNGSGSAQDKYSFSVKK
jgi:hypothetical protein